MRSKTAIAAVIICAALVYLPGLGRYSLTDSDETWHAGTAREMMERGDYIVPYFNGKLFPDKPPMMYWMMIAGFRVFGVGELPARLGSALSAILAAAALYALGAEMFNRRIGLIAGLIMATNLSYIVVGRAAMADGALMLFLVLCFLGFWRVHQGDRRLRNYFLIYVAMGLGGLAKGPVVPAVFIIALIGVSLLERRGKLFLETWAIPGLLLAGAIYMAWMIPADRATGGEMMSEGVGRHVIERAFSGATHSHSGPFFYYIALLPVTFFPWIALLPLAFKKLWPAEEARRHRAFLVAWAAGPFLLFSFMTTKLPHYVLPATPALAIVIAFAVDRAVRQRESFYDGRLAKLGIILFGFVAIVLGVAFFVFPFHAQLPRVARYCFGAGGLMLAMFGLVAADLRRLRTERAVFTLAAGMTVLVLVLSLFAMPAMDEHASTRPLAEKLAEHAPPDAKLFTTGHSVPSIVFYTGRTRETTRWQGVREHLDAGEDFVWLALKDRLEDVPPDFMDRLEKIETVHKFMPSRVEWRTWVFLRPGAAPEEERE